MVILTHAHFDHIGANVDNRGQPMFPNARYVISEIEWTHATRNADDVTRAQLLTISDRVERIALDARIVPGIWAVPAPGHCAGADRADWSNRLASDSSISPMWSIIRFNCSIPIGTSTSTLTRP